MPDLQIGIIGAGVFGHHHASKVAGSKQVRLVGVFDTDFSRAAKLADLHDVEASQSIGQLLKVCDAVVIASPASTHSELAYKAMEWGCHVLVEKPLALSLREAKDLVETAVRKGRILQVGHQERHILRALGLLGLKVPPTAIDLVRAGPFAGAERVGDTSVVWDLMIHDLDFVVQLTGHAGAVLSVDARSQMTPFADEVRARIQISARQRVDLFASRMAEAPCRTLRLTYEDGYVDVDFLRKSVVSTTEHYTHHAPCMFPPDPLGLADEGFFAACLGLLPPDLTGHSVLGALEMAEAIHLKI